MHAKPRSIQETGTAGLISVMRWVRGEGALGVLVFLAEGLPGAGKSYLVKHASDAGFPAFDLDDLLGTNVPENEPWTDRVLSRGAQGVFDGYVARAEPFIFAGASAFQVFDRLSSKPAEPLVRRIYLKEMSYRGERIVWSEGEFTQAETHDPSSYMGSIRAYHVSAEPWSRAHLIFERLPDADAS